MHSAEQPVAGYYRMRLVMGGPLVGIRIWHGQPLDPITLEPMDRSLRWCAVANGEIIEFDRVWPKCIGDPIDRKEYEYLESLTRHAKAHDPLHPSAAPRRRTNWDDSTVPSL